MDSRLKDIFDNQSQMEADRANWDNHWREIAERVLPRQDDFQVQRTGGEKRSEKIFDSTAVLALDRAASAIDSLITPSTQQWHGLEPEDPALLEDEDVMLYLAEVTKQLFRVRYRPTANFASQNHENLISLMAFGTLGMFIDDVMGYGLRYKSIALAELYIAENHAGMIDMVHRKFPMTVRAAYQKWGEKLPESIKKYREKEPHRKFDFIHCVRPNEDIKRGRKDYRGMAFASYYCACEGKTVMTEGGYRTMPYAVSRHVTAPRETYGRSPAMQVLADIKMLNEMEKTTIRAAHKIVDPPLLVYGDGVLNAFSTRPNAMNYGGVDSDGKQLVQPMKMGGNLPIVLEMTEQKRKLINDAFYVTLFQILVENPRMTATEALIRAQEKGQLLAPTVGRQQSEYLGPMIDRELDILSAAGALPEPPPQLLDAGGGVKATYTSPLSRLRRAEDGVAIMRTIEALTPIAQIKPGVFDVFEDMELAREIADINGVPIKVLRSRESMTAKQAADAENAQATVDAKNAQYAASAAKNLGQAAQAAGTVIPLETPQP
jgi:hypothetical protein